MATVPGLTLDDDLLTPPQQEWIVEQLDRRGWLHDLSRRTQHYGYRYDYKSRNVTDTEPLLPFMAEIARQIESMLVVDFGHPTVRLESGYFNQCIVNEYTRKQGIRAHTDSPVFGEVIVSVSLSEAVVMNFTRLDADGVVAEQVDLTLRPGSVLTLRGPARHEWRHEISNNVSMPLDLSVLTAEERWRYPDGKRPLNYRRVSLTYRHVDVVS